MIRIAALLAGSFLVLSISGPTANVLPLNERVLVVYDSNSDGSETVAKYYIQKRNIPKQNLCKIDTFGDGTLDFSTFEKDVKKPIRTCLEKLGKQNILYIVMSYQTPYKADFGGHARAIDQWLADIWDEYGAPHAFGREIGTQPYFGNAQSQGDAYEPYLPLAKYREQPSAKTIYSVWRLDAATPELSKGLVDKALYAETHGLKGKGYFDIRGAVQGYQDYGYGAGEWDIYRASTFAKKVGFETVLDESPSEFGTAPSLLHCDNAALYAGWYSLQHYNDAFTWAPGAIGFHLDSGSATDPHASDNWVGGALIRGITVTSGAVTEPFLEGLIHPDQVFLYLFQGANVGDAVLRSTRWLKWQIAYFGDPLYRPFPGGAGPYKSLTYHESWFGITPNELVGGGTTLGTVALEELATKPSTVAATTSNPELITLPPNSNIPIGGNGVRFPIVAKAPKETTAVTVSITVGNEAFSNTLILYPLLVNLSLSQPTASGNARVTGTVTLFAPAHGEGILVKLTSSIPEVMVPPEVKIPAGGKTGTFQITTKAPAAEATATITATVNGASRTAKLKITP